MYCNEAEISMTSCRMSINCSKISITSLAFAYAVESNSGYRLHTSTSYLENTSLFFSLLYIVVMNTYLNAILSRRFAI